MEWHQKRVCECESHWFSTVEASRCRTSTFLSYQHFTLPHPHVPVFASTSAGLDSSPLFCKIQCCQVVGDALPLQTIKMLLRPFITQKVQVPVLGISPGNPETAAHVHTGTQKPRVSLDLMWGAQGWGKSRHGKKHPWAGSEFSVGLGSAFLWLDPAFYLSCRTLFVLGTNCIAAIMSRPACALYSCVPVR